MGKEDPALADVILAAGGIVWRDGPRGRELAVIHRPRHRDWTLPKGKLDRDERWQEGALREVAEETGFDVELGEFAGSCGYMTRHAPKVVLYWHMHVGRECRFRPDDLDEVDRLDWLTVEEALRRLSHDRERRMLEDAVAPAEPPVDEAPPAEIVTAPFRARTPPAGTVGKGGTRVPERAVDEAARRQAEPARATGGALGRAGEGSTHTRRGFLARLFGQLAHRR